VQAVNCPLDLVTRIGREPERAANRAGRGRAECDGQVEEYLSRPATDGIGNALEHPEGWLLQPALDLREVRRTHAGTLGGCAKRQAGLLATRAKRLSEDDSD